MLAEIEVGALVVGALRHLAVGLWLRVGLGVNSQPKTAP